MDSEYQLQLAQYVSQMRSAGTTDEVIRQELLRTGWQPADIDGVVPPPQPSAYEQLAASQPATAVGGYRPSRRPLVSLVVITAIVAGILGAIAGFVLKPDRVTVNNVGGTGATAQETYAKFTDRNFTIDLAKSWSVDGTYREGQSPVAFYSGEYNSTNTIGAGARMTVAISANKPAQDEISFAQAGYTASGVSYTIVRDNTATQPDGSSRRTVEMTRSLKQQPGKLTRSVFMIIDMPNKKHVYVEVTAEDTAWRERHAETITRMINSFTVL